MKKIIVFICFLLGFIVTNAQTTPKQIAVILRNYEKIIDKYDAGFDTVYCDLLKQIADSQNDEVTCAIWHTCMAQLLETYLNEMRYELYDRTKVQGQLPQDFKTWDIESFKTQISYHFEQSLLPESKLKSIPITDYASLFDSLPNIAYRPTLYDFLAHRVIDFYKENPEEISIKTEELWCDNETFVTLDLSSEKDDSKCSRLFSIYQKLTAFHLHDVNPIALLDLTFERFNFLNQYETNEKTDEKRLVLYNNLEQKYREQTGYEIITHNLGQYYQQRARKYDTILHPDYKYDFATALKWYKVTVAFDSTSLEAAKARNRISEIQRKDIDLIIDENYIIPSEEKQLIPITCLNINKLYVKVVQVDRNFQNKYNASDIKNAALKQKVVYEAEQTIKTDTDYRAHKAYFILPELANGHYYIFLSPQPIREGKELKQFLMRHIQVSSIDLTCRKTDNVNEFFVFNRSTGDPLQSAIVTLSPVRQNKQGVVKLITGADGRCEYKFKDNFYAELSITYKSERLDLGEQYYSNGTITNNKNTSTNLFTDRRIYRPGQKVYFKGIVTESILNQRKDSTYILMGKEVTVTLKDANFQTVEKKVFTTNEYGSFSGEFDLPVGLLNGQFCIQCVPSGNAYFSVEEYKRPTFEVVMEKPQETYHLGDEVIVKGQVKAYAGYGINGAKVRYNVTRSQSFPWWRYGFRPTVKSEEVAHGELITDEEGNYTLSFVAEEQNNMKALDPLYCYHITAQATDLSGETHSGELSVLVSKKTLLLDVNIPESISAKSDNKFQIQLTNTSGIAQNGKVHYQIIPLQCPKHFLYDFPALDIQNYPEEDLHKQFPYLDFNQQNDPQNWSQLKTKEEGDINILKNSSNYFIINNLEKYKSGYYRIVFSTIDNDGNDITCEKTVLVYHPNDSKMSAYRALWMVSEQKELQKGDNLEVKIGTFLEDAWVLCEIKAGNSLISSEWIHLNQNIHTINYLVLDSTLEEIQVHAFLAKDNHQYEENMNFSVRGKTEQLVFDFVTFRDKTQPGAKEEYRIRIQGKSGEKVAAELLCTMYDASLDAFAPQQSFNKKIFRYHKNLSSLKFRFISRGSWQKSRFFLYTYDYSTPNNREYASLLNLRFLHVMYDRLMYKSSRNGFVTISADFAEDFDADIVKSEVSFSPDYTTSVAAGDVSSTSLPAQEEPSQPLVETRSNFNETAFFYPQLLTDENGDVLISFTMPDALTKWKLLGYAHTTDLMSGNFEKFVQTQKELMVVPNEPRFLREGDTMFFSAKVVNLTNDKLNGTVRLSFKNALNNEKIDLVLGETTQSFTAEVKQSCVVRFKIAVPCGLNAVTYHIEALSDHIPAYGDAEEKTLPVLSNQILISESLPLFISGKGSKTFVFNKLKNSFTQSSTTLRHYKLSFEFTPNPVWYAIQSIPYLMEYPYECNEQIFSRIYSNTIASHIVNSNPRIKTVFDQWMTESPDAFCSQLGKNEELKQLLLQETPWVMDANRENADKQRVALLFDMKRMSKEQQIALTKLKNGQNSDGGWPWFAGGRSSAYITEHIIAGLGHLQVLNISIDFSKNMLNEAIQYVDKEMKENYDKRGKNSDCTAGNLHYLYARSFFLNHKLGKYQEMYEYYIDIAKKQWKKQSIYGKAMTALVLFRSGDVATAKTIMANIKDLAQYSEEMGMWWKKEGYGYFWYEAPIERQALLIEAFNTICQDSESVAKMQQWLLKQKQTQNWGTTRATTEACYALLLNNRQIESENSVSVNVGNYDVMAHQKGEPGSGYVKTSWQSSDITADKAEVKIVKSDNGPAWGGLYWQYFENLDKVTQSDDHNLMVRSELYVVSHDQKGEVLVPLENGDKMQVGDKVRVRIEMRVDRDMEYVHLKDMRAAGLEPVNVLSGYKYQDGLGYYECTKDASTNFFFDYLSKGTYVFEYSLYATQQGVFNQGITTIQCMYAPEFSSHSEGKAVRINY